MDRLPIVLCIGGHDPSGGAGIQADIETVAALGARAVTLVTALTAQDTHDIRASWATAPDALSTQFDTLIADIRPDAVKIGLIGGATQIPTLAPWLRDFDGPVVLDPVLAAGGGFDLDAGDLATSIREQLLPLSTLITPNRAEARRLTGRRDIDAAAVALLDAGAGAALITGADEADGEQVVNRLFTPRGTQQTFSWPRLPHRYHGSGCTLASACATSLALGRPLADAVADAQAFTHRALSRADRPGGGQHLPDRRR